MATSTIEHWSETRRSHLRALVVFNVLFAVQLLAAVLYGLVFDVSPNRLHLFLIPFLWITVSLLAVWYARPVDRGMRHRAFAAAAAGGYFLLFLVFSGTVGFSPSTIEPVTGSFGFGVEVGRSLGWGPILYYAGGWIGVRIIPYQVVGYLALSYLVYTAVLNVTKSASAGALGLILCPGCAAAVLAPVLGGVAGLSSALTLLLRYTYEISTVLFVVAMGFLYWQPSVNRLRELTARSLFEITGGIAVVVAGVHLFHPQHGLPRLVEHLQAGVMADPRPLTFTLSGMAMLLGIALVAADIARKRVYLLGIVLVLTLLAGYGAWHTLLDHGAFWPWIEAHGHSDRGALATVGAHLLADGYALVSKLAELALLVLLILCYRWG